MMMIQIGLGMMGSSRRSPLAAMSDAAGPAIRTYTDLDRNERAAEESRDRRLSDLAWREAQLERYGEDREERRRHNTATEETAAQRLARTGGRGRGAGGGASPRGTYSEEQWQRWIASGSEQSRPARQAAYDRAHGGSTAPANDPAGLR
jgi:hypothetical protein